MYSFTKQRENNNQRESYINYSIPTVQKGLNPRSLQLRKQKMAN